MKNMFACFILTLSFVVSANASQALHFIVVSAKFSPSHVTRPSKSFIEIDYAKNTVTLNVKERNFCPPGKMCAQFMREALNVTLPIVSITNSSCGIKILVASKDLRRADGALQKITVEDFSKFNCESYVEYMGKASYITSYFDRQTGKTVTAKSTMTLKK